MNIYLKKKHTYDI